MERLTDRFASRYEDQDVAIWVCPAGYAPDVLEFLVGAAEPKDKVCGMHGDPFLKRCPNPECSDPIYHPSDLDLSFHWVCGAVIPWAERRRAHAQVVDYEPFHSRILGTGKPLSTPLAFAD